MKLGEIASSIEQTRFEQDGRTATGRHVRAVRVAQWADEEACPKGDIRDGEVSIIGVGYAPLTMSTPFEPLSEKWMAHVVSIPAMQAARAQAEREEAVAWRNGTHPSQKPNVDLKRLLKSIKIQHKGSMIDLAAGQVIDDPSLLGALFNSGALIGDLAEAPRARNLQPGEARFRGSF